MVQENSLKKILIIIGATASGKSKTAVKLAEKLNGEIISADSMQVYKKLNIGTGKITQEEMLGIPHHMLSIIEPQESYSVGQYVADAKIIINKVIAKNKLPIIVGGTGLYINALINGHNFANTDKSTSIRDKYFQICEEKGNIFLHELLKKIDVDAANKIEVNDVKRIVRALEIYEITGKNKSQQVSTSKSEYDYKLFILNRNRKELYENINSRVLKMIQDGLIDEVKSLKEYENCQSMQAIGYKEVISMLKDQVSISETIAKIQQNTRHYAKRQLTYFRWFNADKIWIDDNFVENILKISKYQ